MQADMYWMPKSGLVYMQYMQNVLEYRDERSNTVESTGVIYYIKD